MSKRVAGLLCVLIAGVVALAVTRPEVRSFDPSAPNVSAATLARQHAQLVAARERCIARCLAFHKAAASEHFRSGSEEPVAFLRDQSDRLLSGEVEVWDLLPESPDWDSPASLRRFELGCQRTAEAIRYAAQESRANPPSPKATWLQPWTAFMSSLAPLAEAAEALQRGCASRIASLDANPSEAAAK